MWAFAAPKAAMQDSPLITVRFFMKFEHQGLMLRVGVGPEIVKYEPREGIKNTMSIAVPSRVQ